MKKIAKKLTALCLALCFVLCGCANIDLDGFFAGLQNAFPVVPGITVFDKMEYTRPDMAALESELNKLCDQAKTETDLEKLVDGIWAFYDVYDGFSTAYALATIHYYQDLSDSSWAEEYNFCAENAATADAALDRLYRALALSPIRSQLEQDDYFGPGYFDAYEGEGIYDEQLMQLFGRESEILSRYYEVCAEAAEVEYASEEYYSRYGGQLAEIYVELIALRQQIAKYVGYPDYVQFAYDYYYFRDYTPQQTTSYLADIRAELVPLYKTHLESAFWEQELPACTQEETYSYLSSAAKKMGGQIAKAFQTLSKGKLYDIAPGENKYTASFEIYLPTYYSPFIFMNPLGNAFDKLTFSHEFGHFCSDYLSYGSIAGIDVAEIFSQSMEYLSLCYANGGEELTQLKLSDGLCLYVEQAALASFEQQVYNLTGSDLTAENVEQLYTEICQAYGIPNENWDSRSFVTITHYFTNPMYLISYIVSNDAALQIYERELAQKGTGVACMESNLTTAQGQFLAFVREAGLTSPFEAGRLAQVKQLFETKLQEQ